MVVTQADYFDFLEDVQVLSRNNPQILKPEINNFDTPLDFLTEIEAVVDRPAVERRLAGLRNRIFAVRGAAKEE